MRGLRTEVSKFFRQGTGAFARVRRRLFGLGRRRRCDGAGRRTGRCNQTVADKLPGLAEETPTEKAHKTNAGGEHSLLQSLRRRH
jgi:hypothetical protein